MSVIWIEFVKTLNTLLPSIAYFFNVLHEWLSHRYCHALFTKRRTINSLSCFTLYQGHFKFCWSIRKAIKLIIRYWKWQNKQNLKKKYRARNHVPLKLLEFNGAHNILTDATFGSGGYFGCLTLNCSFPLSQFEMFSSWDLLNGVPGAIIGVRIVAEHLLFKIKNIFFYALNPGNSLLIKCSSFCYPHPSINYIHK